MSEAREKIFQELKVLTKALAEEATTKDLTFDLYGMETTVAFCDGRLLLLLWEFSGGKDTQFPLHIHKDTVEHIGFLQGGVFRCDIEGQPRVLSKPGDFLIIPPNTPHQVFCQAKDGPCSGWAILVPPESGLIPMSGDLDAPVCLVAKTGRCGSSPAECVKRKLTPVE